MSQDLRCAFGFHKYDVYAEHEITNKMGETIQRTIVSRCSNCGKIKKDNVDLTVRG